MFCGSIRLTKRGVASKVYWVFFTYRVVGFTRAPPPPTSDKTVDVWRRMYAFKNIVLPFWQLMILRTGEWFCFDAFISLFLFRAVLRVGVALLVRNMYH